MEGVCWNRSLILLDKAVPPNLWPLLQRESENAIIRMAMDAEYKLYGR